MAASDNYELDLGEYLRILRRRWLWIVVPLLILPLLAFYVSSQREDVFVSRAQVLLGDTAVQEAIGSGSQNTSFRNRLLENELRLAKSDAALEQLAGRFGVDVEDVPDAGVSTSEDADILEFTGRSGTPEESATIANAWAETYVALKQQQAQENITSAVDSLQVTLTAFQEERATVREELIDLEDRLAAAGDEQRESIQLLIDREESRISGEITLIDAQIAAVANSVADLELRGQLALTGSARVISEANEPLDPAGSSTLRNVLLAIIVSLLIGGTLALLRESLDRGIRTTEDIESLGLGLSVLGTVPKLPRNEKGEAATIGATTPGSPQAEAHHKIQIAMRFLISTEEISSVLVTSAKQGDGKTTTACNLAISMAQSGSRTILVDSDLRRPRLHKVFQINQNPGLTNLVLEPTSLLDCAWPITPISPSLVLIPAGVLPPQPSSLIASPAFGDATEQLIGSGDFTIFDAPPVLPVADTLGLADRVDGIIVVASAGSTTKQDLTETVDSLRSAGGRILGCVLVGVRNEGKAYEYRYESDDDNLTRMTETQAGDLVDFLSPTPAKPRKSNDSTEVTVS